MCVGWHGDSGVQILEGRRIEDVEREFRTGEALVEAIDNPVEPTFLCQCQRLDEKPQIELIVACRNPGFHSGLMLASSRSQNPPTVPMLTPGATATSTPYAIGREICAPVSFAATTGTVRQV